MDDTLKLHCCNTTGRPAGRVESVYAHCWRRLWSEASRRRCRRRHGEPQSARRPRSFRTELSLRRGRCRPHLHQSSLRLHSSVHTRSLRPRSTSAHKHNKFQLGSSWVSIMTASSVPNLNMETAHFGKASQIWLKGDDSHEVFFLHIFLYWYIA